MTVPIQHNSFNEPITANEIAELLDITVPSVHRKKNIKKYIQNYDCSTEKGRPPTLFKRQVLADLWPNKYKKIVPLQKPDDAYNNIDRRADYDVPRGIEPRLWHSCVETTRECYLSMPTKNISEACRMTVAIAALNGETVSYEYLYNKLTRRKSKTSNWESPVYRQGWSKLHDTKYKVKNNAVNNHAFMRYDLFSMFHNAGLLGKGHGSRRVIVVDDFKRDVWVDDNGEMKMPWGLLFIDGITNYPLMCIPAESINTDTVAAGVLMTAFAHGINEDTIWVFETSRSMKNDNVISLIKSLYTPEQLQLFKSKNHWSKKIFPGQTGPYINSPAQIAQSIFKSKVERSIRNFKDEFDGVYFPTSYQGGDRKEGVQLTLSGSPLDILSLSQQKPGVENQVPHSKKLLPIADFWTRFQNWIWGKYINVPRRDMYSSFRRVFGVSHNPSIKEVHEYFTSDSDGSFKPDMSNIHRFAYVLYYAQPERHKFKVKVTRIGQYATTINNKEYQLTCNDMNESHVHLKVCTIPIPNVDDEFIVMDVTHPEKPQYIGIAHDTIARSFEDVEKYQPEARRMRESNTKRMKSIAESNYRTLGDDFNYESTPPTVEQWTNELGAKQSRLIGSDDDMTDELDNDVIDVEEIDFNDSPKLRRLSEDLGEDF